MYKDIIHLPHPTSKKHPRMSMAARAAQFSPFAALTGHGAAVKETARLTDRMIELDESVKATLDAKLQVIAENIGAQPVVTITYFVPDEKKAGGTYVTKTDSVRRLDTHERAIQFADQSSVPIDQIAEIFGELFPHEDFGV